jgi:predicted alpha/beta superfamily hydrolase
MSKPPEPTPSGLAPFPFRPTTPTLGPTVSRRSISDLPEYRVSPPDAVVAAPTSRRRTRSLFAALSFIFVGLAAHADTYAVTTAERHLLPRSANGRDYALYMGLPASYATSPASRYPVVYVCDGYWGFSPVMSMYWSLTYDNAMPECIVVGIAYGGTAPDVNALRQLDLTPGVDSSVDPTGTTSGQAQAFLGVIADQIIPFIDAQYRTDTSYRVLAGDSYGGLFVIYTMFERPTLFQGLIAASPSLWWRSSYMLGREQDFARTHTALPARLFLAWGGDDPAGIRDSTREMYARLRASTYTNFTVAAREVTGERHGAAIYDSYTRGLRFAFARLAPVPQPSTVDPGFITRPNFANLSTRGRVGGGENVLIGGLIIQGNDAKRVLIRAAGPALAAYGVGNPVTDPRIRLTTLSGAAVAENDNWGSATNAAAIATAASQVGAFSFATGSRDAAILISLEPGLYTATVDSVTGIEGVVLLEAYEVAP